MEFDLVGRFGVFGAGSGSLPTISTTTVRSGTYALKISSLTSTEGQGMAYKYDSGASTGPFYGRFYINVTTLPSAENTVFFVSDATAAGLTSVNYSLFLSLTAAGAFKLYDSFGGQVGSTSATVTLSTWNLIEWWADGSPASGSRVLKARLNGVQFAATTTSTTTFSPQAFYIGGNMQNESQTTGVWYFDDLALNDGSGSFQNSWPGAGAIVYLRPNAAGDNNAWKDSSGFSGTTNNYTLVDEVTPNDGTDYVQTTTTSGALEMYNIDNTPAGIGATDTINVVQVGARFARGVTAVPFRLRIAATSGGTVTETANITPTASSGTFTTNAAASPYNYALTLYQAPTSVNWTKALLDTTQIGLNSQGTGSGSTNSEVSAMWLLVEYAPAPVRIPNKIVQVLQAVNRSARY